MTSGNEMIMTQHNDGYVGTKRSAWIAFDLPSNAIEPVVGGVIDHHVTVVYLGDDVDDGRYTEALTTAQLAAAAFDRPLILDIGRIGCFPAPQGGGKIAWYRQVGDRYGVMAQLRAHLAHLDGSGRTIYRPHVTLAYRDPEDAVIFRVDPIQVGIPCLSVHRKGAKTIKIPFGARS